MKKFAQCLLMAVALGAAADANAQWQPVAGKIATPWSEKVNPSDPLPEYPRPQLTRSNNWKSMNGLWQYAIVPKESGEPVPSSFDGTILVPFPAESSLSGVGKTVGAEKVLWYHRTFDMPKTMQKGRVLLHFGAVDWASRIYVNGVLVKEHEGGYDPFSVDITRALAKGPKQTIAVRVWDPTDDGPQPAGKQVKKPSGIWYTPVTGIWQTVWLENVPDTYVVSVKHTPDIDRNELLVSVTAETLQAGDQVSVSAWDGNRQVAEQIAADLNAVRLSIPDAKRWSPAHPFLYDLKISIRRKGKVIDEVGSYFGMRKSSLAKDKNGMVRMMLNNEFVFQYGPLDQGWWPDGLYTAPTDEALKFDIEQTRALGFNMIRKHIKVEPARWYYHCDKLGVLVWQDMPSGDRGGNEWDQYPGVVSGLAREKQRTQESAAIYKKEWKAILDHLHNYPSIVCWIPFNEAWGQFETKEIAGWTMSYDPSRLVNAASGGSYVKGEPGHILDLHFYPKPMMPDPDVYGSKMALVLGEFGGLGLPVEGHTWVSSGNWGYQSFKNQAELYAKYEYYINRIPELVKKGLSAAVYTQTTDVEVETNGLYTYDRKVLKYPREKMFQLHQKLYDRELVK